MSLETEAVLDRRRLKRRLSSWRTLAVVAAGLALGAFAFTFSGYEGTSFGTRDHIARISIEGLITEDRKQLKMLHKIAKNKNVKALLVYVNSPGGTTTGGEALYEALRNVARKKPVVAQFGTVAASAAYIAGLGCDHIVARGNTITGSVGVIFQWAEVSQLMDKLGVKFNEIKSGPMKAEPSPFKPITPEGRRVAEQMIAESQEWFLSLVRKRRKLDTATVPGLEQGRIYSGREALSLKLVDAIGGEEAAVKWLETRAKRKIDPGLKIVDWKPESDDDWGVLGVSLSMLHSLFSQDGRQAGQLLQRARRVGLIPLDGLVSVWQPVKY